MFINSIIMKYKVQYLKPKKKGLAKHEAVFYNIEDAMRWEYYVKHELNVQNLEIVPI
jgi:hypothetical protein